VDEFHRRARGRGPVTAAGFLPRAAAILGAAVLCAIVSNAIAGPERHLQWVGAYDAAPERPAARAAAPTAASSAPAAAPGAGTAAGAPAARAFPPHPEKPWVEISGDDVVALHHSGDVPFLDARRTSVYREGHIPGARPFSVWESDIDDKVKTFFTEGHDTAAPIVVYCSGGECEDSHMLATKLHMAGFDNALVYRDGYPDWQKRGLPVHTGDAP
jgi:rhodanese-related sulfurtransferase